jgi:hypothetical protein
LQTHVDDDDILPLEELKKLQHHLTIFLF